MIVHDDTDDYAPGSASFRLNYRAEDVHALIAVLKEEGWTMNGTIEESEYGKFAWVIDPEHNKVEVFQQPEAQ